jgi:hypothetical protein
MRSVEEHPEIRPDYGHPTKEHTMRTKLTYFTALFGATAAAVAILTAPVAAAATRTCSASGSANVCQSPGNTQINDATPPVNFHPYGGYGPALGIVGP